MVALKATLYLILQITNFQGDQQISRFCHDRLSGKYGISDQQKGYVDQASNGLDQCTRSLAAAARGREYEVKQYRMKRYCTS